MPSPAWRSRWICRTSRSDAGELTADFTIDEYVRWRLLEVLDDIGITLQHSDEIAAFEQERPGFPPTTA